MQPFSTLREKSSRYDINSRKTDPKMTIPSTRSRMSHAYSHMYFVASLSPSGQTNRMNKIADVNEQFGSLSAAARNFPNGIAFARKGNVQYITSSPF